MIKHTPEPWAYEFGKGNHEGTVVITSYTMSASSPLAHISNICDDAEHDARRIVACVNACAGIATEDLESISNHPTHTGQQSAFIAELDRVKAQRDELLAALILAEPLVERTVDVSGYKTHKERKVLIAVRAAIAKVQSC